MSIPSHVDSFKLSEWELNYLNERRRIMLTWQKQKQTLKENEQNQLNNVLTKIKPDANSQTRTLRTNVARIPTNQSQPAFYIVKVPPPRHSFRKNQRVSSLETIKEDSISTIQTLPTKVLNQKEIKKDNAKNLNQSDGVKKTFKIKNPFKSITKMLKRRRSRSSF